MPFTPFHMGPGLATKAVAGRFFSVTVFGIAQVAMDIEPLLRLFNNNKHLHTYTHNIFGAAIIGFIVFLFSPPFCSLILRRWNNELTTYHLEWLTSPSEISRFAAASGAFFGTFSHVFLDSIMHYDVFPFSPITQANPLHGHINLDTLHYLFIIAGIVGIFSWFLYAWKNRRSTPAV